MEFDEFGNPLDTSAYVVETLLIVAAASIVISAVAVAPALGYILKAAAPDFQFEPNMVGQALRRLTKRGLITKEQQGDQIKLRLTSRGRKRLDQYIVRDLALPGPPPAWDQRWRIVIFDIPEERNHLRAIFRRKLKQLGFRYLQRSAWIYPYPCENVLTMLVERLDIGPHVHVSVASSLSSDQLFRVKFGLPDEQAAPAVAVRIQPTDNKPRPIASEPTMVIESAEELIPIAEL